MSLVNENVFKAVSEDEAMRTQVCFLARTTPRSFCHVRVALSIAKENPS
jgi:hypothetical protein